MGHFKLNPSELSSNNKMKINFASLSLHPFYLKRCFVRKVAEVVFNGFALQCYLCAAFYTVILYNILIMALLFNKWW